MMDTVITGSKKVAEIFWRAESDDEEITNKIKGKANEKDTTEIVGDSRV